MLGSEIGGGAGLVGIVAGNVDDFVPLLGVGEGEIGISVSENVGALGEKVGVGLASMEDCDIVFSIEVLLHDRSSDKLGAAEDKDIHTFIMKGLGFWVASRIMPVDVKAKLNEYVTIPKPMVVLASVGFVLVIGAVLYSGFFERPRGRGGSMASNISNLKQLGTAIAIYESDNDEYLPPHFTFDSDKERDLFIAAIQPYIKNLEMLKCSTDLFPEKGLEYKPGMEGDPAVMSFVHCQSLKGSIPGYVDGRRALLFSTVEIPGKVSLMRDPIRGFGDVKIGDSGSTVQAMWSPHQGLFPILYFDMHVKSIRPLDINKDL